MTDTPVCECGHAYLSHTRDHSSGQGCKNCDCQRYRLASAQAQAEAYDTSHYAAYEHGRAVGHREVQQGSLAPAEQLWKEDVYRLQDAREAIERYQQEADEINVALQPCCHSHADRLDHIDDIKSALEIERQTRQGQHRGDYSTTTCTRRGNEGVGG